MGAKSSSSATHRGLIAWERTYTPIPQPEVIELFDEEADRQWAAACLNLYLDPHERAFAPTVTDPIL